MTPDTPSATQAGAKAARGRQAGPTGFGASAALAIANLLVFAFVLSGLLDRIESDSPHEGLIRHVVWWQVLVEVMAQTAANGLLLTLWKSTRPIGLGILVGAFACFASLSAFFLFVVAPGIA